MDVAGNALFEPLGAFVLDCGFDNDVGIDFGSDFSEKPFCEIGY